MELDQYLGLFIDESRENLQKLNENLLKLESTPGDLDILNDIFRVAHTLKGMSKTMGFNNIGDLTHKMENVLDPLRSGKMKATNKVIDTLFKCLDKLESLVDLVVDDNYNDNSNDIASLIKSLQDLEQSIPESNTETHDEIEKIEFNEYEQSIIKNAKSEGLFVRQVNVSLVDDCVLPAARAYMVLRVLEELGEIIKSIPITEKLEQGDFKGDFRAFVITKSSDEEILESINRISEIEKVIFADIQESSSTIGSTVDNNQVDKELPDQQIEIKPDEKQAQQANNKNDHSNKVLPQTIRVNADRMEKLMDLVGELVINRTQIFQISDEIKHNHLKSVVSFMGNVTTDIQEIVMQLRMVPIEQVFNRFPRLIRDLSKDLGKDVNLVITGKDTEIDRIVIDEIGDPLVHLIRNSLDHGLETPEERIKAGKTAKATLELSAFNEGNNILIKVSDDGRGIDAEKVKAVAVKKGIISELDAKNMSEKDSIDLIFAPGFSTVKTATDLSGRGVGMDVVKSKASALGGDVNIVSRLGVGTTITISLPSTMAIVQALLIKVGHEIYATPLNYINEVIDVHPNDIKRVQNKEVYVFRGTTIPIVRLNKLLDVSCCKDDENSTLTVVIIKSHGNLLGIVVSALIGQQEIVIKPINKKLCQEDYISGATTLGNGQVALIINVNSLLMHRS